MHKVLGHLDTTLAAMCTYGFAVGWVKGSAVHVKTGGGIVEEEVFRALPKLFSIMDYHVVRGFSQAVLSKLTLLLAICIIDNLSHYWLESMPLSHFPSVPISFQFIFKLLIMAP